MILGKLNGAAYRSHQFIHSKWQRDTNMQGHVIRRIKNGLEIIF